MLDISNATAGGPSYGLLDVVFGNKPKEPEGADGKGFGNLMKLIKSLNGEEKDGDSPVAEDASWTEKETGTGKNAVDYRFANFPGLYAMMNPEASAKIAPVQDGQSAKEASALTNAAKQDEMLAAKMEQVANSSPEMRELFEAAKAIVELKAMAKADGQQKDLPQVALKKEGDVGAEELSGIAVLAKELADRGVNLEDPASVKKFVAELAQSKDKAGSTIKSLEVSGAPDKILSTESYLQIHQLAQGKGAKDLSQNPKLADDKSISAAGKHGDMTLAGAGGASAVNEISGAGGRDGKEDADQLIDKKDAGLSEKNLKLENSKGQFASSLDGAIKDSTGAVATKNVVISDGKPEQTRLALMNEVSQTVHSQAVKGGGEMKMIVHPEALGELRLKVGMKDGKVEVTVTAGNEEVAGMLRKSAQDLASSLGDKNLTLAKFEVQVSDKQVTASSDARGGQMEHNLHQQSHQSAFSMMNGEDGRPTRSDYQEQTQPGYRKVARAKAESASSVGSASRRSISSSNRLDVVA